MYVDAQFIEIQPWVGQIGGQAYLPEVGNGLYVNASVFIANSTIQVFTLILWLALFSHITLELPCKRGLQYFR